MKNCSFFIIVSFIFLFINIGSSLAQSGGARSQRWVCLQAQWCAEKESNCSGSGAETHRVRLSVRKDSKPLPNMETYILECVSTEAGQICTSGDKEVDNLIYGKDNSLELNKKIRYIFEGMFPVSGGMSANNPARSNAAGEIGPFEWQSSSGQANRKFLALNYPPAMEDNNWLGQGGQQQGTFSFEAASNSTNCVSIAWDPYGRVFDSLSLEPVTDAKVTLFKKRSDGTFTVLLPAEILGGAIQNPTTTKGDGVFNFVVPDGTYKLTVQKDNYVFPNNPLNINPNYAKIYSDIYPNTTGEEIIQKGGIQHRDIPIGAQLATTYPVKLMEYFYVLDKGTNKAIIEGRASHPFINIKVYTLKLASDNKPPTRYRLIKTLSADKFGKFMAEINQLTFEATEIFGDLELEKIPLAKKPSSFFPGLFRQVEAQTPTTTIRLDPILNYIEGYAYDSSGKVLPRATVGVYLSFSSKAYFETVANERGFYKIPPDSLPDMPYTIKYTTSTGATFPLSTTKFIAQNSQFFRQNKINLFSLNKKSFQPSSSPQYFTDITNTNLNHENLPQGAIKTASQSKTSLILILAMLGLLIVGAGIFIGVYLIKRKNL